MAIAGHVSSRMLTHYSHVPLDVKWKALDAVAKEEVNAKEGDSDRSYIARNVTNAHSQSVPFSQLTEMNGGDDGTRTRDLCRDRLQVTHWRTRNQQFTRAVVGNHWRYRASSAGFCSTICSTSFWPPTDTMLE
jgi:hypothetical protein